MYNGDRARKQALVDFGFRLPSAYDNRPLQFEETYARIHQVIYVSATPGRFEINDQLELGGLLDGQLGRLRALKDLVNGERCPVDLFLEVRSVGH